MSKPWPCEDPSHHHHIPEIDPEAIDQLGIALRRLHTMHLDRLRADCRTRSFPQEYATALAMVLADVACSLSDALIAANIPQSVLDEMWKEARKSAAEHFSEHHAHPARPHS